VAYKDEEEFSGSRITGQTGKNKTSEKKKKHNVKQGNIKGWE